MAHVLSPHPRRIDKYLADSGIGPGTRVEALLAEGKVSVDGVVVRRSDLMVSPSSVIECEGCPASLREPSIYVLLNKSKGIVTTMGESGSEAGTILDLIPKEWQGN